MISENMINIFEYQNYRTYLRDYYEEQKTTKRNFSYRSFSRKADINSSSFLYYVIENKKNLTKKSIVKISQAIGHSREEAEYFEYLVFFNQAKTIHEKTHYYSRIVEIRKPIDIKKISENQFEFYSEWYHSVIREIVTFFDFKDDYTELGNILNPPISAKRAKDSVLLLEKLGFIEKDENCLYHQTNNLISAKPGPADKFVIRKFQTEMLNLAVKSLRAASSRKMISASTTFSISAETCELFALKMREFRKELLEIARLDDNQNQAYQMTMNLFPVSRHVENDD